METTKGWKVRRESDGKRVGRVMESKSGEDGKCVGVRCAIAQGGNCGVRTQGTARVRARDAPTRGTVMWVPSQGIDTWYCHRIPSQDTDTEHPSLEALPRISATAQHHSGI